MSDRFAAMRRFSPALIAAVVCGALLISFWVRSQSAVRGKSSTYDEPMHALGAWVHWHQGDWRINYEDPPLWHYWAALPNGSNAIKVDYDAPRWKLMASEWEQQWTWAVDTLYRTPGNDGEAFVQRSRSMMIVIGVAVGAMLAWWGYRVGGTVCAATAVTLFALDPNFLGHSALVKNDVSMALCTTCLCFALWKMGVRLTPFNLAGAAISCAAAMGTKFSGVLLAPLFTLLLIAARVALPQPWQVFKWSIEKWWQRALAGASSLVVIGIVSYAGVWVAYGMQFGAMPDPSKRMNTPYIFEQAKSGQTRAAIGNFTAADQADPKTVERLNAQYAQLWENWKPDRVLSSLKWLLDRELFPEAWLNGLMFVQARSYLRGSYLDGEKSIVGFRSYFPLAMAYKTPLATILALLGAAILCAYLMVRSRQAAQRARTRPNILNGMWLASCIGLPVMVYMAISINSNLNIGFRHVLPIYPLLFLATAAGVAAGWKRWKRPTIAVATALGLGLAAESFAIAPDYITFFNIAAGGQRGGLQRLGDSNLDWGQDLPLLAEYVKDPQNVGAALYLCYFGMVDPQFYGIRYLNMPGGYELNPQAISPTAGSIVAISATKLQGVYMTDELHEQYKAYMNVEPSVILGGTIYIYDLRKRQLPAAR